MMSLKGIGFKMKLQYKLLTNIYFYIGVIIFLVSVLTAINNYYFYSHVGRTAYRDARQLQSILTGEIKFSRNKLNKISISRYKENIETIVKNFSKNAFYNDSIVLYFDSEKKPLKFKGKSSDRVNLSSIYILIPKLKGKDNLYYYATTDFNLKLYFMSIFRSMTLSVFSEGMKVFVDSNISQSDKQLVDKLENKKQYRIKQQKKLNKLYKDKNISSDVLREYGKESEQIWYKKYSNSYTHIPKKELVKLKNYISETEVTSKDISIAWYRSRPAIGFAIFTIILVFLFRRRELEVSKIEQDLEQERKNKEILETTFGVTEQNDDIELFEAVMSNDITKLQKIKSIHPTMNILKFNALLEHTEEEKLERLEILIEKGIDLNFEDEEGMTALMYYALGNKDNDVNSKIIEVLIHSGLDIDAQNNSGMTALMLCAIKNRPASVQILIDNGADINIKQDLTAKELAATPEIREIINNAESHSPQALVKILSNFTHKPMKFTTHTWDFGSLTSVFGTFDEAMEAVSAQYKLIKSELEELSPNLQKKIETFLFNKDSSLEYSWCSKADVNISWLNLEGLREHCDSGKNAFDFPLSKSIIVENTEISTFGEIIDLFKQEIEIRTDFKNLEPIFTIQKKKLGRAFKFNLTDVRLNRQFYTDTQEIKFVIEKIFSEIKKRKEFPVIELLIRDLEDRSLEIKIIQIDSTANKNSTELTKAIESGDFFDIKESLKDLCDWSVEASCEDGDFRINYLHSNNVKDIEPLAEKALGFTHILRFYR